MTNKAILRQECLDEKLNQTNARLIRENRELSRKINEMKNTFSNYNQLMRELENSQKYLVKEYKKYEKDLDEVREGRNEVKELRELLVREDPFRKPDIIEKLADMKKERKEMEDLYEETLDLVTDAQVVLEKFERARKGIQ